MEITNRVVDDIDKDRAEVKSSCNLLKSELSKRVSEQERHNQTHISESRDQV